LYRRVGFTVGARNRHPWGTDNHIVQFQGSFVELISVGAPELIVPPSAGSFSFGAFTRDFLARDEGLSMLVLEGEGAAADVAAFQKAGIGHYDKFDFEREAKRPDGSTVRVAFSLAFATDPRAPDTGYFTCQQHYPENFWNPAFQNHPNGASAIAGVTMVSHDPAIHSKFFCAFSGISDVSSRSGSITIKTPRGGIEVMEPQAYRRHLGAEPPELTRGGRLAAIRFTMPDMAGLISLLRTNGVNSVEHNGKVVIPSSVAFGATLAFETPQQA
jgi:Glyoxalase-like domain